MTTRAQLPSVVSACRTARAQLLSESAGCTHDDAHAPQELRSCCLTIPCTGALVSQVWMQLAAPTSHSLSVPS